MVPTPPSLNFATPAGASARRARRRGCDEDSRCAQASPPPAFNTAAGAQGRCDPFAIRRVRHCIVLRVPADADSLAHPQKEPIPGSADPRRPGPAPFRSRARSSQHHSIPNTYTRSTPPASCPNLPAGVSTSPSIHGAFPSFRGASPFTNTRGASSSTYVSIPASDSDPSTALLNPKP